MALQSSGPISWSTLNLAYGNLAQSTLSMSTLRGSTVGVGVSNVSMSNFQGVSIPYNGVLMKRTLGILNITFSNEAAGNSIFSNNNGGMAYQTSISIPALTEFTASEWTGWIKVPESGNHSFQMYADDSGEFVVNGTNVVNKYNSFGFSATNTINLNGGVYPFRARHVETQGAESFLISYAPPSATLATPTSTTTTNFVTNNVVWNYKPIIKLDANDLAYIQGVAEGGQVFTWSNFGTDLSNNHAYGKSVVTNARPLLAKDTNGYMVQFSRANSNNMELTSNLDFTQFRSSDGFNNRGCTIFLVGRMFTTNIGTSECFFDFANGAGNNNIILNRRGTSTSELRFSIYANGTTLGVGQAYPNTIDGEFHVYSVRCTNNTTVTVNFYMDNQEITGTVLSAPSGPLVNKTLTQNYLGRSTFGDAFLNGDIREVLVFRETMDTTTISRMNQYLMYKWGISQHMPPVTSGLVGLYTGESWNGTQWTDLSRGGNHATLIKGTITDTARLNSLKVLAGGRNDGIQFPTAILPSTYTLFHVARYSLSGIYQARIFDGVANNWFSGFHAGRAGVAYHGDGSGWVTEVVDLHGFGWVLSTDQKNMYRSQGVDRTKAGYANGATARLSINYGLATGEYTDWVCACVIVYNRELSLTEINQVEGFLNQRYKVY